MISQIQNTSHQALVLKSLAHNCLTSACYYLSARVVTGTFPDLRHGLIFPIIFSPIELTIKFSAKKMIGCCPRYARIIRSITHCVDCSVYGATMHVIDKYFWNLKYTASLTTYVSEQFFIGFVNEFVIYSIHGAKLALGSRMGLFDDRVENMTRIEKCRRLCWDLINITEYIISPLIDYVDQNASSYLGMNSIKDLRLNKVKRVDFLPLELVRHEFLSEVPSLIRDIASSLVALSITSKFIERAVSKRTIINFNLFYFFMRFFENLMNAITEIVEKEHEQRKIEMENARQKLATETEEEVQNRLETFFQNRGITDPERQQLIAFSWYNYGAINQIPTKYQDPSLHNHCHCQHHHTH